MGYSICIGNQKGGVGKTTTAINLAAAFAIAEKKTLLIDMDPQGHATIGMGISKLPREKGIYHGLTNGTGVHELIINSELPSLNLIPAHINLMGFETKCLGRINKERLLQNLLKQLDGQYEYIIIDSPPSINLLTANAITAADSLLIPLQCEFFAVEGLTQFLKLFQILKKRLNPQIEILGILLTMFCPDENVSKHIAQDIQSQLGDKVFKTVIPRDAGLQEAALHGKPLLFHDIKSKGAQSYFGLAKEIMALEKKTHSWGTLF